MKTGRKNPEAKWGPVRVTGGRIKDWWAELAVWINETLGGGDLPKGKKTCKRAKKGPEKSVAR